MARQMAFTKYEAVLLLNAFLQTQSNTVSKSRIVKKCSEELRRMAVNSGIKIDEVYRNVNGISFQIASMESAYKGETIVKPATRLFKETVELYRNNRNQYERLLKKAKDMVSGNHSKENIDLTAVVACPESKKTDEDIHKDKKEYKIVDFTKINSFAFTKPISLDYFGIEKTGLKSWKELYLVFFSLLYEDYSHCLYVGMNISRRKTNRIELGDELMKASMVSPKSIPGTTLFLETNISATDIVLKIKILLGLCNVDYENIVIRYSDNPFYRIGNCKSDLSTVENLFEDNSTYETILKKYFPRGFRQDSILESRKFRNYYERLTGVALELGDAEMQRAIQKCGVTYEGRIYMPQAMLSQDMKEKLFEYITECFEAGKEVIYFEALFKQFSDEFLDYYIYNVDMLKLYLTYMNEGKYHIDRNYLSKDTQIIADPRGEIKTCLKSNVLPMTFKEISHTLSHLPIDKIRDILSMNGEFVRNSKGEYFHVDSLNLSDEELENIATLIGDELKQHDFISGNELYTAIQAKYPRTYEKNAAFSMTGWRDALKYKIGDKFSFIGNIISKFGAELSMRDVFADYGRTRQSFSLNELLQFANDMGSIIYFDSLYQYSIRINREYFVSRKDAKFCIKETDNIIGRFCKGDYISITKITEFGIFPDAGFPWTNYLLESYVASFSEKYYLLHSGYNKNCVVGAIVEKRHAFQSFDDLLVEVLAQSDIPLEKIEALNYLANQGYIARRSYTNIGSLLIYAKEQRNRKGI